MLPSRKISAIFVATFLIGALAGGLATWDMTDTKLSGFLKKTSDPDSMTTRINQKNLKDYQLTPDEQSRIEPLTRAMAQRLYQIRRQFAVDILSTLDDYHQKVSEQLSATQREAYDKATVERKKRMSSMLLLDQGSSGQGQK
jgi:uncharacterized membrane protein